MCCTSKFSQRPRGSKTLVSLRNRFGPKALLEKLISFYFKTSPTPPEAKKKWFYIRTDLGRKWFRKTRWFLFKDILNTPKLKTLISLRKRLGSEIVVEKLIVVIAKSHQTSGAENHWFCETWRSCNAKSSQCECSTKPGERTRNGVVSFWKCTFFCVVGSWFWNEGGHSCLP